MIQSVIYKLASFENILLTQNVFAILRCINIVEQL